MKKQEPRHTRRVVLCGAIRGAAGAANAGVSTEERLAGPSPDTEYVARRKSVDQIRETRDNIAANDDRLTTVSGRNPNICAIVLATQAMTPAQRRAPMFLGWYDPDRRKSLEHKLDDALDRYREKFNAEPVTVLTSVADADSLQGAAVQRNLLIKGVRFVSGSTFYVGAEDEVD